MVHFERSLSWRSTSTIRPRSITRIALASASIDNRCETMMTVRPSAIRRRLRRMIISLSESSALVASSKIRTRGLTINARAIASRCF